MEIKEKIGYNQKRKINSIIVEERKIHESRRIYYSSSLLAVLIFTLFLDSVQQLLPYFSGLVHISPVI